MFTQLYKVNSKSIVIRYLCVNNNTWHFTFIIVIVNQMMINSNKYAEKMEQYKQQMKEKLQEGLAVVSEKGSEVLRNFLSAEAPPTKVQETKSDAYSERHVISREDGLVLYAPGTSKKEKALFEIILHKPCAESLHYVFSLFRSDNRDEVEMKFTSMKGIIPVFINISKEMANQNTLQKICDTLTEHPSWTLAHFAAHFALYDFFNNAIVNSYLNSSDPATGMSPLQVAISTNNLKTVQMLVSAKCSLEHLDHKADSVFHYAASTSKDIISVLSQGSPPACLNARNKLGFTPLHVACQADKPECVSALLLAGADVNISASCEESDDNNAVPGFIGSYLQDHPNTLSHKEMKYGGTPLHWASSRPVIDELIDMKCNINAVNFENRTALHVMVWRNMLECVVALLCRQADPDLGDCKGNTALHLAVETKNLSIVQCLIIFGANLDLLNNSGETARHVVANKKEPKLLYTLHAVGAKRCSPDMTDCTDGCKFDGEYNGEAPPRVIGPTNRDILNQMLSVAAMEKAARKQEAGTRKKGRLLCLDGGGIRGLILIQMLLELERVVQRPIIHCFDWMSGTSTGGILCLGLAVGRTLKECLCLYFRMKEQLFIGVRPYSSIALENVLKDTLGSETVMADIKTPKVLIPAVLADRKPVELHLFRNYKSPNEILEVTHDSPFELPPPPEETLLWHVGRATGAAPTYFRCFGRYLDGGLIANNPTLDALTEIDEYNLALRARNCEDEVCPVGVVVSLGTGLIPVTLMKVNVDVYKPETLWDSAKIVWNMPILGSLLVDQATCSDGRVVDRARAWCSSIGVPYFRFNPQMSEDISMDEQSDVKLCKVLWETKAYMYANMVAVKELANLLTHDR